jgi:cytidylate kinase
MPDDTFRIHLHCAADVAINRIYKRELEKDPSTKMAVVEQNYHSRIEADNKRYLELYGIKDIATQVTSWHMDFDTGLEKNTPEFMYRQLYDKWIKHVNSLPII